MVVPVTAMPGLRISEAAKAVQLSPATLRIWEQQGLIRPGRSSSGQRVYYLEDLQEIRRIQYLRRVERLNPHAIARMLAGNLDNAAVSPAPTQPDSKSLGHRLRAGRRRQGLTLKQVSDQTGLSVSFISAVERGVTGLSMTTLQKLARTCGVLVSDLMDTHPRARHLVRAGERPKLGGLGGGLLIEQLALGKRQMEVQLFTIQPGIGSEGVYKHDGEEFVYLLRGTFEVWVDDTEHYVMCAGDCLYFPSTLPHRWCNSGSEEAVMLWVNTPPTV